MGLSTLLGGRAQGWFIPYRYADTVAPTLGYPAIEKLFDAARDDFSAFLKTIDEHAAALEAIGDEPAPQPRWQQGWFPRLDGAAAYTMVRDRAPVRVGGACGCGEGAERERSGSGARLRVGKNRFNSVRYT